MQEITDTEKLISVGAYTRKSCYGYWNSWWWGGVCLADSNYPENAISEILKILDKNIAESPRNENFNNWILTKKTLGFMDHAKKNNLPALTKKST